MNWNCHCSFAHFWLYTCYKLDQIFPISDLEFKRSAMNWTLLETAVNCVHIFHMIVGWLCANCMCSFSKMLFCGIFIKTRLFVTLTLWRFMILTFDCMTRHTFIKSIMSRWWRCVTHASHLCVLSFISRFVLPIHTHEKLADASFCLNIKCYNWNFSSGDTIKYRCFVEMVLLIKFVCKSGCALQAIHFMLSIYI